MTIVYNNTMSNILTERVHGKARAEFLIKECEGCIAYWEKRPNTATKQTLLRQFHERIKELNDMIEKGTYETTDRG